MWISLLMALTLITPPALEPLTVDDVVSQVRIDSSNQEPAPDAPALALVAVAGNVTAGAHRALCTFVTADGETQAGLASAAVTADAGHGQIDVTLPTGGATVTGRNVYLTMAGGSGYYLAAQVADNTTATVRVNVADGALGTQAPATNTTADPQITAWIRAARYRAESFTGRKFITQTWDALYDGWPWDDGYFDLEPNLQSVSSISYIDVTNVSQTLATAVYLVDAPAGPFAARGRAVLKYAQYWPPVLPQANAITVRQVLGYGDARSAVPDDIKIAMLLTIGTWYEARQDQIIVRGSADVLPRNAEALLRPYRVRPHSRQL